MRTEIGAGVAVLLAAGLVWFFAFSPFWWYTGRHNPPWPSQVLELAEYDAAELTRATDQGTLVCGAEFEYAIAGGVIADGGLYLHVVVAAPCDPEYPAHAVAESLSTILNLGSEQWLSISDASGKPVALGRRERPTAAGPGKPTYITPRLGSSFDIAPINDRCREVAIVWGKVPPGLNGGTFTVQTTDQSGEVGLIPGQSYRVKVIKE